MKSNSKKIMLVLAGVIALCGVLTLAPDLAHPVVASSVGEAQSGLNSTGGTGGLSVPQLIKNIISLLSYIVGAVAIIMLVVGGLQYATAQGDGGKIASAKNTIIYALAGLVIAVFAQAIVQYILNRATQ